MRLRLRSRTRTNAAGEPLRFRNLTASGPSTKERKKLTARGEAMKDGSFPIRDVEDLRNAIQSVGRAKDYDAAKRWIMKRARELDAEDELPDDWTKDTSASLEALTAARRPFDESKVVRHPKGTPVAGKAGGGRFAVKTNAAGRHEVVSPEGKKVAETTDEKDADKIASEKNAAYGLDGGGRMPPEQLLGLTIDQADEMLHDGRLGQADYEAFRHVWAKNAVDPESPNARGWLATPEDPAVLERVTALDEEIGRRGQETTVIENTMSEPAPIEGPHTYPSGWTGRYDPAEGRYIGMDDIYMPADFDPTRDAGSAMVQPERSLAPMKPRDVFLETAKGSIRRGLESGSSTERIKAQTAQSVLNRIESGEIELTDEDAITLTEGMNRVEGNPDRSVNSLMLEKVVGVGITGTPSMRRADQARIDAPLEGAELAEMQRRNDQASRDKAASPYFGGPGETTRVENRLTTIRQPGSTPADKLLRIAGFANRGDGRSYGGGLADYSSAEILDTLSSNALTSEGTARLVRELAARGELPPGMSADVIASADPCDECDDAARALVAAIPVKPPEEWFELPTLDGPTPMTVTDDGRIYGHAAVWGTCHLGNPRGAGVCVQPPRSQSGYGLFHLGEVETASGARVPVGQITLDTGHAPLGASARNAAAHYDHTGTCAADVVVGEDEHGIVFAGALRPDMTPERARTLMGSKISGDWRGGELVGLLAVNVPGFPVPRARLVASAEGVDEVLALVAAGVVTERSPFEGLRPEAVVEILAARAEGIDALAELAGA